MNSFVFIKADYNDADYVASLEKLDIKSRDIIDKVINVLKKFPNRHNWESEYTEETAYQKYVDGGFLSEEEFYAFDELLPNHENGIHTIVEIKILHCLSTNDVWPIIEEDETN